MAILYKNGDMTINVRRIDILIIPPTEKNKVEIYFGLLKHVMTYSNEEEAKKVYNSIYALMLQEQ